MTPGSARFHDAGPWTTTRAPRVPDRFTSLRAIARSGRPEAVPEVVYGQYWRYPAKPGGRSWQVGRGTSPPPSSRATARRSSANATALRASSSSNGATFVLRLNQTVVGQGEVRSSSGVRSADPGEQRQICPPALGNMSSSPEPTRSAALRARTGQRVTTASG